MKPFFRGNMNERCRWCLVILLGVVVLTANRELEIVPTIWDYMKGFIPAVRNFFG
ncbi:hypothetical protein SAMN06265367_11125 [Algoriphagus winogradskyi]|uniref:Uncharacterized protein n=1 Tax=Algoriphagus winogradskyi TaxID=237017 RepID=A0ABY1PLZ8_9BACT|nr:hypothetical protein SAMN06265367_11125 [Algoriphagus winogradskyi]